MRGTKPKRDLYQMLIDSIVLPVTLGIDEVFLGGIQRQKRARKQYRCVFGDLAKLKFVAVLQSRKLAYVSRILFNIPEDHRRVVQVIAIDMWRPFKLLAKRVFPRARIVIDKFHVVRIANDCLDSLRIGEQEQIVPAALADAARQGISGKKQLARIVKKAEKKRKYFSDNRSLLLKRGRDLDEGHIEKRDRILAEHPSLRAAYLAKEAFYFIWDEAKSPDEARTLYKDWLQQSLPKGQKQYWNRLITAMANWDREIFNYFIDVEHPVTNAYTEYINRRIRRISRQTCACKLETVWIKLQLADLAKEQELLLAERKSAESLHSSAEAPASVTALPASVRYSIESSLRMSARLAKRRKKKRNRQRGKAEKCAPIPSMVGELFPATATAKAPASGLPTPFNDPSQK